MQQAENPDITVLASFSGEGGVERMLLNLVNAFAGRGYRVHLVLIRSVSQHLNEIHPDVNCIRLGSHHSTSLLPLLRYLRTYKPKRMLVAKDRAGRLAVKARALAGSNSRLVLRLGTNLSAAMKLKSNFSRWLRQVPIRRLYPKLDRIIAVSDGVARDTIEISGVSPDKISVVRNPVLTSRMAKLAREDVDHPWLQRKTVPVILGAGRLTEQKDFPTLLRAFAELRKRQKARLIILGGDDGKRDELLKLVAKLHLHDAVDLPGFNANPYAYMARADLFVLSSRWEGSPNVLTEAMGVGTPVVATDCPSGPNEILQHGRIAPLVPVGDWKALTDAMEETLRCPPDSRILRDAVKEYELEASASHYLKILGLPPLPV